MGGMTMRLDHLMCSLAAPVDQILWDFESASILTWPDLVQKLRSRYGSKDQSTLFQAQLAARRQKDGEDLATLVQDVRRLMTLAYPGCASEYGELLAVRAFLDALKDRRLSLKVREREPQTLDQAFKFALRLDGYRRAAEEPVDIYERRPARNKAIRENSSSTDQLRKLLREELEPQRARMAEIEKVLTSLQKPPVHHWTGPRPRRGNVTGNTSSPPAGTGGSGGNQPNERTNQRRGRCFECNRFGHYARDCPRRQEEPTEEEEVASDSPGHVNHVEGSAYAYLPVRVNGRNTLVLLDSGSEMSMAPASYVRPADLKGSTQLLRAANGTEIRVLGESTLRCKMDDVTFLVPCLVTEQLSEIIFGLEFLERHHANWNFGERSLHVFGGTFALQRQPRTGRCRKIVVAVDTRVPAFSEADVTTYAVIPNLRIQPSMWATPPQMLSSGVMVASTLLPSRILDVAVRMLNPTESDIIVKRGEQCLTEDVTVAAPVHQSSCAAVQEVTVTDIKDRDEPDLQVLAQLWEEVDIQVPAETRTALKELVLKHRQVFSQHDDDIGFNDITQHEIDPGNKRSVRQPLRRQTSTGRCNKIAKLNTAGTSPCTRQKVTCSADSVSLLPSAYDDHMVSTVQSMCCRVEVKVPVYDPCEAATAACPPVVSRELHRAPSMPQVLPVVWPDDHSNLCSTSRCEASRPRRKPPYVYRASCSLLVSW